MNNTSKIYITCLASKEVIQVNALTGLVEARIPASKYPYAVLVDNSSIYTANFWKNTPEYIFKTDNSPNKFYLTDPILVEKNSTAYTNTIIVADISEPTYASVPDIHNAVIFKNNVNVGTKTTVVEGDQLKVRYTTPNTYSTRIEFPLFVGSINDWFISETRSIDDIIDPFYFVDVFDAQLNSEYISNEIEITDIDVEVRLVFNIDYGTIILNGVDTGVSSTIVQLGDKIRIRASSDQSYCGRKFISASCSGYTNVWSIINTKNIERETKYLIGESNKSLFDLIDGTGKETANYVEKILDDSVVASLNLDSSPLSNGVAGDVFYVADYLNSRIIKVDLADGVEQVFNVAPDKPYKVAWKDDAVFYTCPDSDRISNLDKSVVINLNNPKNLVFNQYEELLVACDDGVVICRKNTSTLRHEYYGKINAPNTSLCDLAVVATGIVREKSCAKFTGTEYVNVSADVPLALGSNDWTFETYVKIDSTQHDTVVLLSNAGVTGNQVNSNFSFYLEPASNDRFVVACDLYYSLNNTVSINNANVFNSTGAKLRAVCNNLELLKDTWYHIAYTRNDNQLKFFVNGQPTTNIHVNFSFLYQVYTYVTENALGVRTLYNTNYSNFSGVLPNVLNVYDSTSHEFNVGFSMVDPLVGKHRGSATSFKGLLSNLRLTNGTAVYQSQFVSQFPQLSVTPQTALFLYPDNTNSSANNAQNIVSTVAYDGTVLVPNEISFATQILFQDIYNLIHATDIKNNSVHEIEGYFFLQNAIKRTVNVKELPYSLAKDSNNLYVANFGHSSISTISLSSFSSTTTFLPEGFSFPIDIEIDSGKLYIATYGEPYLLEYDNGIFTDILLASNPIAVNKVGSSIWTTELYGDIVNNEDVGISDFIQPIVIPDQLNALFDTFYESQIQTIAGQTTKSVPLYLEPYVEASIIKNGVDVGKSTSFVVGDTFKIKAKSLSFFKKPKTVGLYSCKFQTTFTIITLADTQPDIMMFDPYTDAILRSRLSTQELPITGVDPNEEFPIEIIGYSDSISELIEPQLIVNGVNTMSSTAMVKLGDTIGFSVLVKGITWNGDRLPVKIRTLAGFEFAYIDIYTAFLEGPVHETKPRERKEDQEYQSSITYTNIDEFIGYDVITRNYDKPSIQLSVSDLSHKNISFVDYVEPEFFGINKIQIDADAELISFISSIDFSSDVVRNVKSSKFDYVPDIDRSYQAKTISYDTSFVVHQSSTPSERTFDFFVEHNQGNIFAQADYTQGISYSVSDINADYVLVHDLNTNFVDASYEKIEILSDYNVETCYYALLRNNVHSIESDYVRNLRYFMEVIPEYLIFTRFTPVVQSDYDHIPLYTLKLIDSSYERKVSAISEYILTPKISPQAPDFFVNTGVTKQITSYYFTEPKLEFKPYLGIELSQQFVSVPYSLFKAIDAIPIVNTSAINVASSGYIHNPPVHNTYIYTLAEHRKVLTNVIDNIFAHNSNLSISLAKEFLLRENLHRLLGPDPVHSEVLQKFLESEIYVNRNLDKFLDRNAVHSEVLQKSIIPNAVVYSPLSKLNGPDCVNSGIAARELNREIYLGNNRSIIMNRAIELNVRNGLLLSKDVIVYTKTPNIISNEAYNFRSNRIYIPKTFVVARAENVEYFLSTEEKRTYATEQEAIDAALAAGFTGVKIYQLPDSTYYWFKPSAIINNYCNVGNKIYPVGWYMHGG